DLHRRTLRVLRIAQARGEEVTLAAGVERIQMVGPVAGGGAGLAEGRDRAPDQRRRRLPQQRRQVARRTVLDQDIDPREPAANLLAAGGGARVEDEAALAAVEVQEAPARLGRGIARREWPDPARGVAAVGRLDLEDLRAEVGQQP